MIEQSPVRFKQHPQLLLQLQHFCGIAAASAALAACTLLLKFSDGLNDVGGRRVYAVKSADAAGEAHASRCSGCCRLTSDLSRRSGARRRVYAAKAAEAAGDTRKKMRRLAQELRALQGAQGLPLQAAAAILLRHDSERPDKMRALITGALLPALFSPLHSASLQLIRARGVKVCYCCRQARMSLHPYAPSHKICRTRALRMGVTRKHADACLGCTYTRPCVSLICTVSSIVSLDCEQ